MRLWVLSILGGLLAAPAGAVVAIVLLYLGLAIRGESEREGRRGLMAGTLGVLFGAPGGFVLGFRATWALASGAGGPWATFAKAGMAGIGGAVVSGIGGYVAGRFLARRAKYPTEVNAGVGATCALTDVAVPACFLGGVAGFILGWCIVR